MIYLDLHLKKKIDKTNFISPKSTPPKSPHQLGLTKDVQRANLWRASGDSYIFFRRMIRAKSVDLESEQQSGIAVTIDFSLHNENDQKKQQQTDNTNQGTYLNIF